MEQLITDVFNYAKKDGSTIEGALALFFEDDNSFNHIYISDDDELDILLTDSDKDFTDIELSASTESDKF